MNTDLSNPLGLLKGDRVMVLRARDHASDREGEIARIVDAPDLDAVIPSLRVEFVSGPRDRIWIRQWLWVPETDGDDPVQCAATNPEAPTGYRCELATDHPAFIIDVNRFEHAAPSSGAFWNVAPSTVTASDWFAQYPSLYRVGATGWFEAWSGDCTCEVESDVAPYGHREFCGWEPVIEVDQVLKFARAMGVLRDLSVWIDDSNGHRDPEARTWGRIAKTDEEIEEFSRAGGNDTVHTAIGMAQGRVVAEMIAMTGQNPRKGEATGDPAKVSKELGDVAVTSLAADESLYDNDGQAMVRFLDHLIRLGDRMDQAKRDSLQTGGV